MSKSAQPVVYLAREWWSHFVSAAKSAKHSIYLQSLTFEEGEMLGQIMPTLETAARRGVKVRLHIDWVAQFYVHGVIKLLPRLTFRERAYAEEIWQKNHLLVERLRKAGAEFVYTNQFNWWQQGIKIAGRNHQKIYAVDEKIAWIGGVNLLDKSLASLDVMIEFRDEVAVKESIKAFWAVDEQRFRQDQFVPMGSESCLLIDNGTRGQSVIYEHAVTMARQAKRAIVVISQFVPEGVLRQTLIAQAKAGINVTILTSPVSDRKFRTLPYRPVFEKFVWDVKGITNLHYLHLPQHVHAKVMLVDDREVLVGSHNLVETGINLGTQEIAYQTRQANVVKWFREWLSTLSRM